MGGLRILWLNWRCIKHPLAGGAEVYTHEVATRLAGMGHEVLLVTSRAPGLPSMEDLGGYRVIRRGGRLTVYPGAWRAYRHLRGEGWRPDVVVDEVNTIPFLTPLYAREPIVMLIHQLCRDCWRHALHPLAQPPGWLLERLLHKPYTRAARSGKLKAVVTVSESTRSDLLGLGYPPELIHIAPNGLDWSAYRDCPSLARSKEDLVAYVGRIAPYKRLQDLLRAWSLVEREHPEARLEVAGRADPGYLAKLKRLAGKLGLRRLQFKTSIPHGEKKRILAKAKTLAYTSTREGWGQTILEAAACETPAVAYNVPGLRDSVKHMETGILVPPGNTRKLAEALATLLADDGLRERLAGNAYKHARNYTWDKTAEKFHEIIEAATA